MGRWAADVRSGGGELVPDPAQRRLAAGEGLDHGGVELPPGLAVDLRPRLLPAAGCAIGAVARHRIQRVGDGEDPRSERDLLGREPVRIAVAVPALVVRADDAQARALE